MSPLSLKLGAHEDAVRVATSGLVQSGFGRRLLAHDDALWGTDPSHRAVAANRLGWLEAPVAMQARTDELEAFADEVAGAGFTHVVLLGMGGSSLAPEVFAHTFGTRPGRLALSVLDNTSPASVEAIASSHDLRTTLFLVASKSGGTLEVVSFEAAFWERVQAVRGNDTGAAFVAITDPGTSLAALAKQRGYRRVFLNPPDIGGRYSSLSCFGLVPAALIGADVQALLAGAVEERAPLATDAGLGIEIGAALGALARAGRDKLTLVLPPALASYGTWIEQLVAESTGKSGVGILPVAEERLADPARYGGDRVFVAIGVPELPAELSRSLTALAQAGHPVLQWSLPGPLAMGADMLRWEVATAAASAVLGVDPFDEPNVSEAKAATAAVLERAVGLGRFPEREPAAREGALSAFLPQAHGSPSPRGVAAALRALVDGTRDGDYVALLAYMNRTPARHDRLEELRHLIRDRRRVATTLGYGPRFLHSTGQLHKGGSDAGVFLQLTADEGDSPIPGQPYGFADLRASQSAGDFEVLERRGRRALRIHLGRDVEAGLDALIAAVASRR